ALLDPLQRDQEVERLDRGDVTEPDPDLVAVLRPGRAGQHRRRQRERPVNRWLSHRGLPWLRPATSSRAIELQNTTTCKAVDRPHPPWGIHLARARPAGPPSRQLRRGPPCARGGRTLPYRESNET